MKTFLGIVAQPNNHIYLHGDSQNRKWITNINGLTWKIYKVIHSTLFNKKTNFHQSIEAHFNKSLKRLPRPANVVYVRLRKRFGSIVGSCTCKRWRRNQERFDTLLESNLNALAMQFWHSDISTLWKNLIWCNSFISLLENLQVFMKDYLLFSFGELISFLL